MKRRILVRSAVIIFLVLLALVLYNTGRGYTLLLDNKAVETDGETIKALDMVKVQVDGEEPIELYPRDRDMVLVSGKKHTINIIVYNKNFVEVASYRQKLSIPKGGTMFLLKMPALAAESPNWLEPFAP